VCADGTVFVGYAQYHSSGIGATGKQLRVVRDRANFLVNAAARHHLRDHLFALNVALDAQVAPLEDRFLQIRDERRIAQVRELFCWDPLQPPICP
jgi:hypothetical protein